MSLIPHSVFPRKMMDMDSWMKPSQLWGDSSLIKPGSLMGPSSLDMFDPFDELDTLMGRDINWLSKPEFLPAVQPRVQQKYRITVDCPGFEPSSNSIKTDVKGNTLVVSGHDEDKLPSGDYHTREFKKTYELPEGAETNKMVSFMPMTGTLVIEIPLRETNLHMNADLMPKIISTKEGKAVSLNFGVPANIDPSKVHVSIKDRDLICKADDVKKTADTTSKLHYYKRTTLPENTDFDKMKVTWEKKTN
jgi:HSP20 family molecular chaperone IbpA